jgi:serine/threonine-protein kinase HipA
VISEQTLFVGLATDVIASTQNEVIPAGVLKLVRRGNVESSEFAYGRQYLKRTTAESLNPLHLPLQEEIFRLPETRLRDGGGMPLTIRDALPDSWGRKVLEAKNGGPLSDVQALLLNNEDRVGALVFTESLPMGPLASEPGIFTLEELADAARQFDSGQEPDVNLLRLLQGGSLGGARPKATFIHKNHRHIAKFPARGDDHDVPVLEAVTMALAKACGIKVPDFFLQSLGTGHALVMSRFDRGGPINRELRRHYLSASALLDVAYENNAGGSYVELAQMLRRISVSPGKDLHELYQRLVFNLFVGNSDDHVKNHGALLSRAGFFNLAPAFDLVMQLNENVGYQSLAILPGQSESHLDLAREVSSQFGWGSRVAAELVIKQIGDTVRTQVQGLLNAYGADRALKVRVEEFLARQRRRIGANN